jgi:hypothetical protein
LPLFDFAYGPDPDFEETHGTARGIVAIGDEAHGWLAIDGSARGYVALGGSARGLIALGGLTLGGVALGGLAAGGVAVGRRSSVPNETSELILQASRPARLDHKSPITNQMTADAPGSSLAI